MSKAIVVDFDTLDGERDFDLLRPIGVLLEMQDTIVIRYRPEVADEQSADTGVDNYLRTTGALHEWLTAANAGELPPGAATPRMFLVYLADQSYPGLRFRNIALVGDDVSLDEAYEKYVVAGEPLPEMSEYLSDWSAE